MVTHAGGADLPIIERACGARPRGALRHAARRRLRRARSAVARLARVGDARRPPRQGEQLTDWSRRPLSAGARGTPRATSCTSCRLPTRVARAARASWVAPSGRPPRRRSCARSRARDRTPTPRGGGSKALARCAASTPCVAQAVAAWRERRAQELDRPARFVLSELVLAGLAARPPRTTRDAHRPPGRRVAAQGGGRGGPRSGGAGRAMPRQRPARAPAPRRRCRARCGRRAPRGVDRPDGGARAHRAAPARHPRRRQGPRERPAEPPRRRLAGRDGRGTRSASSSPARRSSASWTGAAGFDWNLTPEPGGVARRGRGGQGCRS